MRSEVLRLRKSLVEKERELELAEMARLLENEASWRTIQRFCHLLIWGYRRETRLALMYQCSQGRRVDLETLRRVAKKPEKEAA